MSQSRVECLNSKANTSGRTLALLTQTISGAITQPVSVHLQVAALGGDVAGGWKPGAHAGLLFGVGGPDVHYKRSALVQQAPAEDGGWLLSVNHEGRLRISSFHDPLERSGYWTLPGGVDFDALPVMAEAPGRVALNHAWLDLTLHYEPNLDREEFASGRLSVTVGPALGPSAGWTSLVLEEFPEADLIGSVSLFSALGASGSEYGFGFQGFEITGGTAHPDRALGPVLAATYLVDRSADVPGGSVLRLTAHVAALGKSDPGGARLMLQEEQGWVEAARGDRTSDGTDLVRFEVEGYRDRKNGKARAYRVELDAGETAWSSDLGGVFEGSIRPEPRPGQEWVLASLSCLKNQVGPIAWNKSGLWFPHEGLVSRVAAQDPDLLYFSGDQIYEGDLTGPNRKDLDLSIADYQTK
ncbi:MAG: hypothetical protein P1V35_08565, partial [Planctomycetota bacterium]|nr:hypothetical protein [Planctomycetota bacterium]